MCSETLSQKTKALGRSWLAVPRCMGRDTELYGDKLRKGPWGSRAGCSLAPGRPSGPCRPIPAVLPGCRHRGRDADVGCTWPPGSCQPRPTSPLRAGPAAGSGYYTMGLAFTHSALIQNPTGRVQVSSAKGQGRQRMQIGRQLQPLIPVVWVLSFPNPSTSGSRL